MTSSLETEWDYSGRKRRDGQKKKIGKANERKRKVKGGKDEVNGQGEEGCPVPTWGLIFCGWEGNCRPGRNVDGLTINLIENNSGLLPGLTNLSTG